MRAKHPIHLQAPAATAARGSGRPDRSRLPRPRSVAAGGALLVQLWGIGLGASCAQAATPDPGAPPGSAATAVSGPAAGVSPAPEPHRPHPRTPGGAPAPASASDAPIGPADDPPDGLPAPLLGGLTDSVPALGATAAAPVDRLLQERIRAGGLPLPGQGKTVPDAFAIAAVLLPSTPSEPHDAEPRASRDADPAAEQDAQRSAPDGRSDEAGVAPNAGPDSSGAEWASVPVAAAPAATAAAAVARGGATGPRTGVPERDTRAPLVPAQRQRGAEHGPNAVAGTPVGTQTTGTSAAVLVPITAGLLLTGAAMYKHRGLPKGH
ncbi:hypothetical protein [Kitasatospora sp. NPDC057223]|uniref:hypothetical protein n=1 Tax=Kitasatospora sp. NPDC057223 TaxID=3346055 RepID=UPI00362B11E3